MFYSFDNLVGKNGQFALIWKIAMFNDKRKKLPRASIMDVDIPKTCNSLLSYFPSKENIPVEARTKFSLYLLSQLMYGVVLIFESQTYFLEIDVKTARVAAENIFLNPKPLTNDKEESHEKRKGTKRKFGDMGNIDIKDLPPTNLGDLDKIGVALYNQITLQDPIPRRAPAFPLDEELPIITIEQQQQWELQTFLNELESRSGGGDQLDKNRAAAEEKSPFANIEPLEFPIQEPDWLRTLEEPMDLQVQTLQEPTIGEQFSDLAVQPPTEEPAKVQASPVKEVQKRSLDVLELEPEVATPSFKRRRVAVHIRDDVTMLPWNFIKESLTDYSSTLRTIKDVIARPQANTDIEDLFKPYPTWMDQPFNKELRNLYKSTKLEKLSYEEAAKMVIGEPIQRGPESQLWRYEGSSVDQASSTRELQELKELDEDLRLIGVAHLQPTPKKRRELSIPRFDISDMPNINITGNDEFRVPGYDEDLEFARRSSIMGGPAGVSARHSTLLADELASQVGRADLVSMEDEARIESVTRSIIKEKIIRAVEASVVPISLKSLIPTRNTNDKDAARAFSSLLGTMKSTKEKEIAQREISAAKKGKIKLPDDERFLAEPDKKSNVSRLNNRLASQGYSFIEQIRDEKPVDLLKRNLKYIKYTDSRPIDPKKARTVLNYHMKTLPNKNIIKKHRKSITGLREPKKIKKKQASVFSDKDFQKTVSSTKKRKIQNEDGCFV